MWQESFNVLGVAALVFQNSPYLWGEMLFSLTGEFLHILKLPSAQSPNLRPSHPTGRELLLPRLAIGPSVFLIEVASCQHTMARKVGSNSEVNIFRVAVHAPMQLYRLFLFRRTEPDPRQLQRVPILFHPG